MSEYAKRWPRLLRDSGKPAYLAIAELIASDIKSGRLTAKDRLPPLRMLADDLGLNYTTVARGYAEARRRGLIDGRAGQGTFIPSATARQPARRGSLLEMTMNLPPEPQQGS
jgi:DNA-binding transcriptional regulator YhcF (GntR family)